MKLSFVIPCYASENTIESVVNEVIETVSQRPEFTYEIILVSDDSPDDVYSVIKKLAFENTNIKGIELAKNFGQHAALMAGFRHVSGDIVVCLDDDGQTPANELFSLVDEVMNGKDIVYAKYLEKKHSLFRNFGSFVNERMSRAILNKPKDLSLMSYFACKRFIVDEAVSYENPYPYVAGLLMRSTKNMGNVIVNHRERQSGSSEIGRAHV